MRITLLSVGLAVLFCAGGPGRASAVQPEQCRRAGYDVTAFGARGDSLTLCTRAIQAAVDSAAAAGGGAVRFPPGRYLSGTIVLKSHVSLHLGEGAVLLGSTRTGDYPRHVPAFRSYTDNYVTQSLIYAEGQHDIAITGRGTLDGQGAAYPWEEYRDRPDVIRMVDCRDILIEGIHLRNSALWMQHYLACDNLRIQGIEVYNHSTFNNDMLDIDCCHNVTVSDCRGDCDDDGITLKSTAGRATENVTITGCFVRAGCNAIKLGTESNGGFKNIVISNCAIDSWFGKPGFYGMPLGIAGIALEIVDGGTLENVTVSNISLRNVSVPLFLRLANRARPFKDGMEKPGIGSFSNVVISNIVASCLDASGSSITGLPGHPIRNVTLSNIRITAPGGGTRQEFLKPVPELEKDYPEATMFGNLPACGFYCRHVEGLRLRDVDIQVDSADARPAMVFEDVARLELNGVAESRPGPGAEAALVLRDVREATLAFCRKAAASARLFVCTGDSSGIRTFGNADAER
ncbi:glycoside hydrolase [bacterium]|nr:glycoside hydrolase [bacterium]